MENIMFPTTETKKKSYMRTHTIDPENIMATLREHMFTDGFDFVMDLERSQGAYLYEARSGKKYLDMFSFVASSPLGMNHPRLNNPEFIDYIGKIALNKPSNSDIYNIEMAELVKEFFKNAIPSYFKYVFFVEGGSVAVENALKAAFDWKVKKNFKKGYKEEKGHQVIHFRQSFHGRTGYTLSITNTDPSKTDLYPKFSWPRISNPKIQFPINENNIDDLVKRENDSIEEIKKALHDNKDDIACMIIEPIQGEGGDNHFRKEFFENLRTLCDENEMLFIIDEVQTGLGMTGKWWCHEYLAQPDIMAFGKKSQVCGILVSDRIDDIKDNVFHTSSRINSTWGGNLVDMVRFKEILRIIDEEKLVENARIVGEHLLYKILCLQEEHPNLISHGRGRGLYCAMDVPDAAIRKTMLEKIMENGVLMLPSGERSIRFRPSLNITTDHIDECIVKIEKSIKEL